MQQSLTIFVLVVILTLGVNAGEILESEKITDWGDWGFFARCQNGTFVQGFALKTEPYKGPLIDDTSVNAVRLYCGDPDNINTRTISSLEGHWGVWEAVKKCPQGGYINGFALRVEQPFLIDDETATNNIRFYCNNDAELEGDGTNFGTWRSVRRCGRTEALCAIQTQLQGDQALGDDTALNNIAAECCEIF